MNSLTPTITPNTTLTSFQSVPERLRRAVQRLASIHDGIEGQSIPHEVMQVYKAVVRKDSSRRTMIKEAVLGLEQELQGPTVNWDAVRDRHQETLISRSLRISLWHMKQWVGSNDARQALVRNVPGENLERLRVAYVLEGMEVFEEVLRFARDLADRRDN